MTPKWSDKPLLKSYQKTKPPLGWPRVTDSLCPTCVKEARAVVLRGDEDWRAEIISRSSRMADLLAEAHMVARSDASVLLRGDSGSGKEMLARATINRGGRPPSENPRKQLTLRLPAEVIERWKATGPGWQTPMAERLSKVR